MLSDTKARQARPRERAFKIADQGGYLLVSPTGAKSWRYDYRLHGRRETLTLGTYPRGTACRGAGAAHGSPEAGSAWREPVEAEVH
jgi:Arm DNA-binding domain